jgi:hypothetical protein
MKGKDQRMYRLHICSCLLIFAMGGFGADRVFSQQTPVKMGTTAASFLEIGVGSAAIGMGSAYTTMAEDLSAIYWNPGKLAYLEDYEVMFMHQPWLAGINFNFMGASLPIEGIGVLGLGITRLNSGDIEETTLDYQEGTGSYYDASSIAVSFVFARKMTPNFTVGFAGKYIMERISTMQASSLAVDLGVHVVTPFFERPGSNIQGIQIGMCIANYGGKMKLEGNDTFIAVDPETEEGGNNDLLEANYHMQEYELPTVFRVGVAYDLFNTSTNRITVAADAVHPNNNYEFVNTGVQYRLSLWDKLEIKIRGGYKTLFLVDSVDGLTLGFGMKLMVAGTGNLRIDYAFADMGYFGKINSYTLSLLF